ncbi:MAG TPA: hypothetical protein EYH05_17540 [Anaerolineae bacterium]|nr:hypothetical protein [Anaerolineae bacterium]
MGRSLLRCVFACLFLVLLAACTSSGEPEPPGCDSDGISIVPTATRQTDPDLFSPPAPPPDGGDGAEYCPTPIPAETPAADFPTQFVTTKVANLSLDVTNQDLVATAVGDDMLAVAWLTDGEIYIALSRGGNHFQVRRVDSGSNVALVFSSINRLHVVYEQGGQIFYRAADQGVHPADVEREFVAYGTNPTVVLNQFHYAQIIYEDNGTLYHAAHMMTGQWQIGTITEGAQPALVGFGNDLDMGYIVAYRLPSGDIQLAKWLTSPYGFFPVWQPLAQIGLLPDEEMTGSVGLDFLTVSEDEAWVYASWVTKRPFPETPLPLYAQPIYEAANPLYPNQIANPDHIYEGLNAVRWRTEDIPFDAGLMQTINVTDPNGTITFEAWGLTETAVDSSMTLRIGIDPTGGDNPDSPDVVWSDAVAPVDFTQFSVSVPAQGRAATIFLRGVLDTTDVPGTAVWDSVMLQNGALVNGDFEGPLVLQDSITVPEGWTAWYQDSGNTPINGRDVYTVYAAWSDDGGSAWTGPEAITANRDTSTSLSASLSGGTTGAIRPDVTPIISMATDPPSVSFFYIYETGDPPPDTTFLRFGRPYQTQCDLGTADCTDTPGAPLLPRNVVRPSYRLLAAADPFNPDRAILTWDSLQTDTLNKDVYATYTVLR